MTLPFEAALLNADYLKRRCDEAIEFACNECGGPTETKAGGQFECVVCLRLVIPAQRCSRCKALLLSSPGAAERDCYSVQIYRENAGNSLPAFAPSDQLTWAFRESSSGLIQVATEEVLRSRFLRGELAESAEVSSLHFDSFKLARDSTEFGAAFSAGLRLIAERVEQQRTEKRLLAETLARQEVERLRVLEKEALKNAAAEKKRKDDAAVLAGQVAAMKRMTRFLPASVSLAVMIAGLVTLYFLRSSVDQFYSALTGAAFCLICEFFLSLNCYRDYESYFWRKFWIKERDHETTPLAPLFVLAVQIVGTILYILIDWIWPLSDTGIGAIFPHTFAAARWYLLFSLVSIVTALSIPVFLFDLQIWRYYKVTLKKYV